MTDFHPIALHARIEALEKQVANLKASLKSAINADDRDISELFARVEALEASAETCASARAEVSIRLHTLEEDAGLLK